MMRFIAKKAAQRFENAFGQNPFQETQTHNRDEVTIEKKPKTTPRNGKVVGEYIDFDELD